MYLLVKVRELMKEGFSKEDFFYSRIQEIRVKGFLSFPEQLRPLLVGYAVKRGLELKEKTFSSEEAEDIINACLRFNDPFTASLIAGTTKINNAVRRKIISALERKN